MTERESFIILIWYCNWIITVHNNCNFVGRVRMLDNNDKVLQLVEYDGKSVSVIVIWGGVFLTPKTGKEVQLGGLQTLTGKLNPPPRQFPHCVTRKFGSLSIYLFMLIQNSLSRTVFNTPKTCHITPLLASLHCLKLRNVLNTNLFLLHTTF